MNEFVARPLDDSTWPDFARLVERHNGVWSGCWCMAFHSEGVGKGKTQEQNRLNKEVRVREGRAHAALVYEGDDCVGWCQFGPTSELPRIKNRRVYESGLAALPDWRITRFFVAKDARRRGVASAALGGALDEIARLGGGAVESYRRRWMVGRLRPRSFTTRQPPCSSITASNEPVRLANTTG